MPCCKFFKKYNVNEDSEAGPSTSRDNKALHYEAPEELLTFVIGSSWSRWRMTVMLVFCIIMVFFGLNVYTPGLLDQRHINMTCFKEKHDNTDHKPCSKGNGSSCSEYSKGYKLSDKCNLICHKERYASFNIIVFQSGIATGFIILGCCADRWGRKKILFISLILHTCFGILVTTSGTLVTFAISKFFYGFFLSGTAMVAILLTCEISTNKWRTFNLAMLGISIAIGHLILPYIWMIFADCTKSVLLMSIPQIILILFMSVIRESPNWFLCKNQTTKAETVLISVANFDGLKMPDSFRIRPVNISNMSSTRSIPLTVMMKPGTTLWAVVGLNVLSLVSTFLSGLILARTMAQSDDPLLMTKVFGEVSTVASIVSTGLCYAIRHKLVIALGTLLGSGTAIVQYIFQDHWKHYNDIDRILQLVAYGFIMIACFAIWNVIPRIFPTPTRGQGVGITFSVGKFGFIAAPMVFSTVYHTLPIFLSTFCASVIVILICCLLIYSVHNRELPDVIEDCINFRNLHKPMRWTSIRATSPTIEETEVKITDFERGTSQVVQNAPAAPVSKQMQKTFTKS